MASRSATDERGFTLPELLVVVLIIGILAAISLAVFMRQRDTGNDGVAKAEGRQLVSLIEACDAEQEDYRSCDSAPALDTSGVDFGTGTGQVEIAASTKRTYTVRAHSRSGNTFDLSRTGSGTMAYACGRPGRAGCRADGTW